MKLKERMVNMFFGEAIEAKVAERIKAASSADLDNEDTGWRKLTGDSNRNLSPLKQERMIEIVFYLWENNPFANWIIEIIKDFILAEGMPYEARHEDVRAALDDFWYDPLNRMDLYLEKYIRELFLYGELCLPVYVAEQTGKVRLGYVDPAQIKEVVTDPENVKMIIGIILKDSAGQAGRKIKTIIPDDAETIISPAARTLRNSYTDGGCFFFAINNVTNSPRGRSELLSVADWLDAYEQFLFDYADKWPLLNSFVWDLTVEGGTTDEINKHLKAFTKKSGSIYGHNEKVKLSASTPDLKSIDAEAGARLFRNHILGGKSLPEHWFGGGGDVNRATSVEMGTPAFKALSSKQKYVKYIIETIFDYVIYGSRKAGYLNVNDEDVKYSVIVPELSAKDITKHSTVLQQVATSLMTAELQGWIDKETARKIFAAMTAPLGVELDLEQIKTAVIEEAEKKGFEDY